MATLVDVSDAIAKLGKLYGRTFDDAGVLVFFAEAVCAKLTPDQALAAIKRWAVERDRFPVPAQLVAMIIPPVTERDEANEMASAMVGAISRRGYTWPGLCRYDGYASFDEALIAEFGDTRAVEIVNRAGGWPQFCQQFDPMQNTNARPQLRDLIESKARLAAHNAHRLQAPAPAQIEGVVDRLASKLGKIPDSADKRLADETTAD